MTKILKDLPLVPRIMIDEYVLDNTFYDNLTETIIVKEIPPHKTSDVRVQVSFNKFDF